MDLDDVGDAGGVEARLLLAAHERVETGAGSGDGDGVGEAGGGVDGVDNAHQAFALAQCVGVGEEALLGAFARRNVGQCYAGSFISETVAENLSEGIERRFEQQTGVVGRELERGRRFVEILRVALVERVCAEENRQAVGEPVVFAQLSGGYADETGHSLTQLLEGVELRGEGARR